MLVAEKGGAMDSVRLGAYLAQIKIRRLRMVTPL